MKAKYKDYDWVSLTAVPSAGYVFDNWTGDIRGIDDPGQNPVAFKMLDDADNVRSVVANFSASLVKYRVAAGPDTGGGGSVTLLPDWAEYPVNQTVNVSAKALTGYIFSHWEGDLAGTDSSGTLHLDGNKTVTAIFNPTVTIESNPSEAGAVQLSPDQSANGYSAGTVITLEARAGKGYKFKSWGGDLSGTHKTVTVTMDGPKTISALFVKKSGIPWWAWLAGGVAGLAALLILVRLVRFRRMSSE